MKVDRIRLAARIIGFGTIGFGATMLIGEAIGEFLQEGWAVITEPIPLELVIAVVIGAVALTGCILSWWRERPAGVILVSSAAAMGIHVGIFIGRNQMLVWSILGLPYLIAGVLFLNSWRLSRQLL